MNPKILSDAKALSADAFRAEHERFVARKQEEQRIAAFVSTFVCGRCRERPSVDGHECRECRAAYGAWMWEAA